ncbi:hypothetical protein [Bdellovibrio sp. KM01]|uniref:bestrophin-like domain n=1 Tax=Bdellovibrio sp. KM01 TaxID=2748865 RepID=UPI001C674DA2|nr:hypothetical protein [Bdellovibrio sp. KM01]
MLLEQIEILYSIPLVLVSVYITLIFWMAAAIGKWIGNKRKSVKAPADGSNFVPTTILGLMALVLGFTFSMAVSRFDQRKNALVQEANAIGTAYLRAQLLPPQFGNNLQSLLKEYVDVRISFHQTKADRLKQNEVDERTSRLQDQIWKSLIPLTSQHKDPIVALTVASVNDVFDRTSERKSTSLNRIPELVYFILISIGVFGVFSMGYVDGRSKNGTVFNIIVLSFLFSLVISLVLDIDRPQRGLIQNDQRPLLELKESFR